MASPALRTRSRRRWRKPLPSAVSAPLQAVMRLCANGENHSIKIFKGHLLSLAAGGDRMLTPDYGGAGDQLYRRVCSAGGPAAPRAWRRFDRARSDSASRMITWCPFSARNSAVSQPTTPPPIMATRRPGLTSPSSTSQAVTALALSRPGSFRIKGRAPVARITASGFFRDRRGGGYPCFCARQRYRLDPVDKVAQNLAETVLFGGTLARMAWPPSSPERSAPPGALSRATRAASSPAGPPPTTTTFWRGAPFKGKFAIRPT